MFYFRKMDNHGDLIRVSPRISEKMSPKHLVFFNYYNNLVLCIVYNGRRGYF